MATTTVNCLNCNKEFGAENRDLNRGWGKFCSSQCSSIYNWALKRGPNTICGWCEEKFYRKPSKKKDHRSKSGLFFCCREHKDLAQRVDGLNDIKPSHYKIGEYRKKALSYYGLTCNRCGYNQTEYVLEVHHKDRDRSNNALSNLEVLCANCHKEEHLEDKRRREKERLKKEDYDFKIIWPVLDDLKAMVNSSSYVAVSKKTRSI